MLADIIINEKETVAYLLIGNASDVGENVGVFHQTFKNAFCIFVESQIEWKTIQMIQTTYPAARFLFAENVQKAVDIIVQFSRVISSDKRNSVVAYCEEVP